MRPGSRLRRLWRYINQLLRPILSVRSGRYQCHYQCLRPVWCGDVQCMWRCYAADPRSQFTATWVIHVRQSAGHLAATHNIVRSFSRVARRASVSLTRLRRTSKNSCSPDAPSSSSATAPAADKHTGDAVEASGLLLADTDAARPGLISFIFSVNQSMN